MEKPTLGTKFNALLATGRIANLPTVWSNVLVGFWIASFFIGQYTTEVEGIRLGLLAFLLFNTSCIYVGGCMLGDALDIEFDKKNRPNRPLPQGILSVGTIKFIAFTLLILALTGTCVSTVVVFVGFFWWKGIFSISEILDVFISQDTLEGFQMHEMLFACLLTTCVVTYAFVHKKNKPIALILMASCRFFLVLFAIASAHKSFFGNFTSPEKPLLLDLNWLSLWMFILAIAVGTYTLLLSWVASTESEKGAFQKRNLLCGLLLTLPLLTFVFQIQIDSAPLERRTIWATEHSLGSGFEKSFNITDLLNFPALFCALTILYAWLFFALRALKTSKPAFVSRALAGFCLLDACFIAAFAPGIACICLILFGLALLLQRFAPAT